MVEIKNVKVYELEESVIACRNAVRTEMPEYTKEEFNASLERAIKLAKMPSNSGHANFLTGIRVAFDIKYPNYFTPELQRYHFVDIVTSSSKMHRLVKMNMDMCFTKYVKKQSIDLMKQLVNEYNENPCYETFIVALNNCPLGVELFMRCNTNYMQLRNIYHQRKNHKLKEDWGAFCKMIEELPYFEEFINK
jgi:hypothetical protein